MDCRKTQEWLLRSDLQEAGALPAAVAGHLAGCADCRGLAERLRRLESAARAMPEPAGAAAAKKAFLARLPAHEAVRPAAGRTLARRVLRWSAAAAALLATAIGLWLLSPDGTPTADASTALDQLVDWNIEMADTASPANRGRLYSAKVDAMKRLAREDRLSEEDRDLTSVLLENGERLSRESDPAADAEGFTDVAAVLVRHMGKAAGRGDARRLNSLTKWYNHVIEKGINARLEKFDAAGATPERDRKLERLLRCNAALRDQLAALLEQSPNASKAEIRRALALHAPKHQKGK